MSRWLQEQRMERLEAEVGTIFKPHAGRLRIALAYPNRYFIGMSNVGFQSVYKFWNENPDVVCERVFLPDRRELEEYRRSRSPLLTLESGSPVGDFDVLAFSVTFEPDELNLISILDLAGIPAFARERGDDHPLVLVGGPVTFLNPEPMAPFVDVFAVGEAEALLPTLTETLRQSGGRGERLQALEQLGGYYVPEHYDLHYDSDGTLASREHRFGASTRLVRAKMGKRPDLPPPATHVLTKSTEMSGKLLVEVSRGCPTLCRFCWAGYNYLPKRSFQLERILELARDGRAHTKDIGLVSTAVGAHPEIVTLIRELSDMDYRVSVSSLRFEDLRADLVEPLVVSGERTLAVAPEVGTDRLRFSIHKRVSNAEILDKADMLFASGVENLKLYLMVGLPGEIDEDLEGIVDLVASLREPMLRHGRRRGRLGRLIPSINPFIPKPGTPFQWHAMRPVNELARKVQSLQRAFARMPNVEANCKSPRKERLQALLSMGDARLGDVLLRVARGEAELRPAMKDAGLDLDFYIHRERGLDEVLPWSHIDNGMKPELLTSQYRKAKTFEVLPQAAPVGP